MLWQGVEKALEISLNTSFIIYYLAQKHTTHILVIFWLYVFIYLFTFCEAQKSITAIFTTHTIFKSSEAKALCEEQIRLTPLCTIIRKVAVSVSWMNCPFESNLSMDRLIQFIKSVWVILALKLTPWSCNGYNPTRGEDYQWIMT